MKKNPSPIRQVTEVGMLAFGLSSHVLSLDEEFQVLPVHLRADEPVVELLRRVGEAEDSQQKEESGGQNQQHNADAA